MKGLGLRSMPFTKEIIVMQFNIIQTRKRTYSKIFYSYSTSIFFLNNVENEFQKFQIFISLNLRSFR